MKLRCEWCGREFEPRSTGRRPRFCSEPCRKKSHRADERAIEAADLPVPPAPRTVTDREIAGAVVQARGAQATFDAGRKCGPRALRPLCDRLAEGIGEVLGREGL